MRVLAEFYILHVLEDELLLDIFSVIMLNEGIQKELLKLSIIQDRFGTDFRNKRAEQDLVRRVETRGVRIIKQIA